MVKELLKPHILLWIIRLEKLWFLVGYQWFQFEKACSKYQQGFYSTNQGINLVKTCQGEHPNEFLSYALSTINFHLTNTYFKILLIFSIINRTLLYSQQSLLIAFKETVILQSISFHRNHYPAIQASGQWQTKKSVLK